jgi:TPR repeat protein
MDAEEQHKTALCYFNGDGVEKDSEQAIMWWTLSANQGYAKAQYNLGVGYYNGCGVQKNLELAVKWWTLSANQENANA